MMRAILVALALALGAVPADAQSAPPAPTDPPQPSGVEFMPRFDFRVSMEHLFSEEPRFVWGANFGGDIDLVSFDHGRVSFVANYETILGSEFRAFDPNQGNYILEGSVSAGTTAFEAAGVFHHVSRHLSDRPKRGAVDWNMVGGRIRGGGRRGGVELQGRADVRGVIQHTYVDYRWEIDTAASARVAARPRIALVATGGWRVLGVDDSRGRDTQHGYRGEGGIRFDGRGATLDLFVAAERRIDPYQLEFSTVSWLTAGFRISSPGAFRVP